VTDKMRCELAPVGRARQAVALLDSLSYTSSIMEYTENAIQDPETPRKKPGVPMDFKTSKRGNLPAGPFGTLGLLSP
jgi:hypothetical protein